MSAAATLRKTGYPREAWVIATKHFHATNHPVIQSFEPGEDWGWCYIDQMALQF